MPLKPPLGAILDVNNILTQGLQLIFLFNEGTGANVYDLTGNMHIGVLTNMAPASDWIGGNNGWELDFDGSDDRIEIAYDNSLDLLSGFTLELIFTTGASLPAIQALIGKPFTTTHSSPFFDWSLALTSAGIIEARTGATTNQTASSTVVTNTRYHLIFTADGVNWKIYLDSKLINTFVESALPTNTNSQNVRIGANRAGGERFNGSMELVKIYDIALSSAQVERSFVNPYELVMPTFNPAIFGTLAAAPAVLENIFLRYYSDRRMRG
jgi:hypothetical protein